MKNRFVMLRGVTAMLLTPLAIVRAADPDPYGVLLKPIPDKLVVLTFDDACLSHATLVAPLLKKHGFGATFYVTMFGRTALDKTQYPALFTVLCKPSAPVVRRTLQEPGFVRQQGKLKGDISWVKARSRCLSPLSIAP